MTSTQLFVGGLNYATTTEKLLKICEQYGSVTACSVVTDRSTGQSRGFAFVDYATPAEAQAARAALNGARVDSRVLIVDIARAPGASRPRQADPVREAVSAPAGGVLGAGNWPPARRPLV